MAEPDRPSIWMYDTTLGDIPSATASPVSVDVIVVGAGLAGLCIAEACARDGATVAVVEARGIATRTTGHSTAKLTALHGSTYSTLRRGKGSEVAAAYASANVEGVARLRALIVETGIECDLTAAPAASCAETEDGISTVEEEAEAARAAGLDVAVVDDVELPIAVRRAVVLGDSAHLDPVALCRGLAAHLSANGALVVEQTRVTAIDESSEGCRVQTETGLELRADAVVQATHLPVVDPALLSSRVTPQRSYALAAPMATPPSGMYLAVDGGWSIRPWFGGEEPMVIVGGEGHTMLDEVETASHHRALADWAQTRLGVTAERQWSAFDYETSDGLPMIGRLTPRSHRRYVATGFHKWGLSTSMVSAMIIADAIAGRPNPYASTFDSTRLAATVTRDLAKTTVGVANRWLGDRVRARRDIDPASLAPGESRTVRRGMTTIAVAKDDAGVVHAVQASCTHLGCVVGFNAGEQTWDCPCHGSRFALDGTVIDGPATSPLQQVPLDELDARRA